MRAKQVFQTIVIQYDELMFKEAYQMEITGKVAIVRISKITDANYYIEINLMSGWIDWLGHYPAANKITQDKGLTVMVLT